MGVTPTCLEIVDYTCGSPLFISEVTHNTLTWLCFTFLFTAAAAAAAVDFRSEFKTHVERNCLYIDLLIVFFKNFSVCEA